LDLQNNFSELIIVYFYGDKVILTPINYIFAKLVPIRKFRHILHFRSAFRTYLHLLREKAANTAKTATVKPLKCRKCRQDFCGGGGIRMPFEPNNANSHEQERNISNDVGATSLFCITYAAFERG